MTIDKQRWQDRLTALADKHDVVGASLAIQHGEETAEAAAGVLNLRTGQPATPDSVFQIGSISKVWTATLVMQLVDEGLLDLDEPVVTYLPDFQVADPEVSRTVTARQLLSHTSGIDGDLFLDTGRGDDAVAKYVAAMSDLEQSHPQGAIMSYCNSGYTLLGHLVATLRGATWETVLREKLLVPLGLSSAGTLPEEALLFGAAAGHLQLPGMDEPDVTPQWGIFRSAGPAGLIHTAARDQLVFAQLHLSGGLAPDGTRLLSEESATAMRVKQVEVKDPYTLGSHWGLGWILMDWSGRPVFGHDGATLGQAAFLRVLPDAGLSVSLTTNGGRGPRDLFEDLYGEVFASLASVDVPRRPEPPAVPVEVDPTRFVGTYRREAVEVVVAEVAPGRLQMTMRNTGALAMLGAEQVLELVPYDEDTLLAKAPGTDGFVPAVFFDLDGERYLHSGARAIRRVE
ncbi:MAG: serine hydrolase [Frankiales bacterium]|nr:serine hydrolase [Frankiales bacterium]